MLCFNPAMPSGSKSPQEDPINAVLHVPEARRFELRHDSGAVAELTYTPLADAMNFDHTYVPDSLRGRGIAAALTRGALQEARRLGWKIVPSCSYVASYIQRHPEFSDLLHQS